MQVVEKAHHINATFRGYGISLIKEAILKAYPESQIIEEENDDEELELWENTDIAKEIKSRKTPGRTLAIYRDRSGMTLVQLAEKIGTKYTNISAMENDRRPIGLRMAKKLGEVLNVDYTKFLR
ncbi:MAG: helix-turn-helix transcriptional regulator [Treponema sp.]|jgi:DNA-binding XRE family transcriptional regulator|nr:helix-turn-helix transcriptional regulator [Treponema sp.]